MKPQNLFFDPQRLFEELCTKAQLGAGFRAVRKNKGAAGIDGVSIEDFQTNLEEELGQLQQELESWVYKPSPVRLVEIPKPGSREKRKLGVPTIRDRVVQTAIKQLIEPILEPLFSDHSYGFRPGRNQKQAVEAARDFVNEGKEWCVDIDLSKFFDRVGHDRLMSRLGNVIVDKRILRLIGMTLRSGTMRGGVVESTQEGTTQGSPLSPLLSNFVLDELDKRLEARGFSFCRFADDANVFVGSKKAADRLMENLIGFIEGKLKLKVNREKSQVARSQFVKFLGMTIVAGTIAISSISLKRAMTKVRELSPRGTHLSIENSIKEFNGWYQGWANYYKMTQYPAQLSKIEAHYRRRLRSRLVSQHKNRSSLFKKLRSHKVPRKAAAKAAYSQGSRWALSHTRGVEMAYSNQWFEQRGLYTISERKLEGWFDRRKWIRLT
jgi:group II intron reverse transcriptase/maturase